MEALAPWHVVLILVGFVLLFGSRRLPDAARSLGRSLRIFRSEMRELRTEDGPGPAVPAVPGADLPPVAGSTAAPPPPEPEARPPVA